MSVTGLFDGLEDEVSASVASIAGILENYPYSTAGKALKAEFSILYWHFFESTWTGLDSVPGTSEPQLVKAHVMARLYLDENMLSIALYRAFRRALYCKCFNGIDLAQMKQAGLFAFWIAKIHPIVVSPKPDGLANLSNASERDLQEINERFAFYVIEDFYRHEFGHSLPHVSGYMQHFMHAVKFRSFTEDSMMLVTESLGVAGSVSHSAHL
ncbi:MAG: hypothetical protein LBD25_02885 [Coriobacteriales bacterium]|jgi:hypothetical protein|nr:hypothetical protein [Coriobacteriales bacterium]